MANIGNFNADEHESNTFEPIPDGKYPAVAIDSEVKSTKNGDGSYLKVQFEIIDGSYKGRRVFTNFNLENPNEQAVQIGKRQLADFCRAVGVITPHDSAELHHKPLLIKLSIKPASGGYEASNDIKGYFPMGFESAEDVAAASAPVAKKPWEN